MTWLYLPNMLLFLELYLDLNRRKNLGKSEKENPGQNTSTY